MPARALKDIEQLSNNPGVYFFYDAADNLIYVGKAKNLRRRLAQYRKTSRIRKHRRMRGIIRDTFRYETRNCPSELDALLLENEWIQKAKPKWNIVGAFYFMYPIISVRREKNGDLILGYSTEEASTIQSGSRLFGSYRSRSNTRRAFFSMNRLIGYIGHREKKKSKTPSSRSEFVKNREQRFRQLSVEWEKWITLFFNGESSLLLEKIVTQLLDRPKARRRASEVQTYIDELALFYSTEAKRLKFIRDQLDLGLGFIPQRERDRFYLLAKHIAKSRLTDGTHFHSNQISQSFSQSLHLAIDSKVTETKFVKPNG